MHEQLLVMNFFLKYKNGKLSELSEFSLKKSTGAQLVRTEKYWGLILRLNVKS